MPHKGPNTVIDANTDAISNYLWMEVALNAHAELTDTNAKRESSRRDESCMSIRWRRLE
jgi:hypothetical protein